MNIADIKAFVKKHTQSPEEYITEFDVEGMNEWLLLRHASVVSKMETLGLTLHYEKGADTMTDVGRSTNNFWMVLSAKEGRFSLRAFAEGAEEAKALVSKASSIAPTFKETLGLVDAQYPKGESFLLRKYLKFPDWIVETTGLSMDWSKNAPSSIYKWTGETLGLFSSNALDYVKEVCRRQQVFQALSNKDYLASKMRVLGSKFFQTRYLKPVRDEEDDHESLEEKKGYLVGGAFQVIPMQANGSTLEAWVLVNPEGYDWSPMLKNAFVRLSDTSFSIWNDNMELNHSGDIYWQDEFLVYSFTDQDLNLPGGSIATLTALGQTPFEILQYALLDTGPNESYSLDFLTAEAGMSN